MYSLIIFNDIYGINSTQVAFTAFDTESVYRNLFLKKSEELSIHDKSYWAIALRFSMVLHLDDGRTTYYVPLDLTIRKLKVIIK